MSIILDALRKSESERQRQAGAGIADAGYRPAAPRRSVWIPILVVVLVANLAALGIFWWKSQARVPVGTVSSTAAADAGVAPPAREPVVVRPASAARIAGTEDPAGVTPGEMAATPDDAGKRTEILEPPAAAAPAATIVTPEPAGKAGIPTAEQMMAGGLLNGTALHLDLHVYSARAPERFVMINMRRYTEGAQLQDGMRLEEITPDGAVLTKNGMRFLLPRE